MAVIRRISQIIQNRAVGSIIAVTVTYKVLQCPLHRLHFPYLRFQFLDMGVRQFFHFRARAFRIIPKLQ